METNFLLEKLIGLSELEARELCKNNGYSSRVVRMNSEYFIVTADLRHDRINLEIDNDVITKCEIG